MHRGPSALALGRRFCLPWKLSAAAPVRDCTGGLLPSPVVATVPAGTEIDLGMDDLRVGSR
jgi:hypothetical protein